MLYAFRPQKANLRCRPPKAGDRQNPIVGSHATTSSALAVVSAQFLARNPITVTVDSVEMAFTQIRERFLT